MARQVPVWLVTKRGMRWGMELMDIVVLQTLLEGVGLPAEKDELIRYAAREGATPIQLGLLQRLPDREYETIDEAAEELRSVQPQRQDEVPHEPREESGEPPGGDDYTTASPVSGAVREDESSTID
jgi:hypothetical protein